MQGCKCARCDRARDKGHNWSGCKCWNCSKIRDQGHNWAEDREWCSTCGMSRAKSDSWVKDFEKSADPVSWNVWVLQHRPDSRLNALRALIALKDKGLHTHDISIGSTTKCAICKYAAEAYDRYEYDNDYDKHIREGMCWPNLTEYWVTIDGGEPLPLEGDGDHIDSLVSFYNATGDSVKVKALRQSNPELELVLASEAYVNAKDNDGTTPLHEAVFWGSRSKVVWQLLVPKARMSMPRTTTAGRLCMWRPMRTWRKCCASTVAKNKVFWLYGVLEQRACKTLL